MSNRIAASSLLLSLLCSTPAFAEFSDLLGRFSTDLEEQSARAALDVYERLQRESGCSDSIIITPQPGSPCSGQTFKIFNNVREIVHTGNAITRSGPTEFSLGSDLQGLGFALRWLAAEEYAAQGDMSSDFAGGQISGLSSRLSALRFGAQGFQFVQNGVWQPKEQYSGVYGTSGGAASNKSNYSRWGGFANIQGGFGSREGTGLEDAFDIDGLALTVGADYRINDEWIVGLVVGFSEQEIDFDASQSIVEGGIDSSGYSVMPFFMYQPNAFYFSGSLGIQVLSFDSLRAIRYPSFNPSTSSTNTETVSSTDANITSLFVEAGYSHFWRKMTFEPYVNFNTSNIIIDEFIEDDVNDDAFDLVVKEQNFNTLDMTLGIKAQYTFTPKAGVFIPYFTLEQINQVENDSRDVEAYYASLLTTETNFSIPTEVLDSSYQALTIGFSTVLRGGRELTPGGSVGGDFQAFANIKKIIGLDDYELTFYSIGLRYAF